MHVERTPLVDYSPLRTCTAVSMAYLCFFARLRFSFRSKVNMRVFAAYERVRFFTAGHYSRVLLRVKCKSVRRACDRRTVTSSRTVATLFVACTHAVRRFRVGCSVFWGELSGRYPRCPYLSPAQPTDTVVRTARTCEENKPFHALCVAVV